MRVAVLVAEPGLQICKIALSRVDERRQFLQLRNAHGRLHVGGFEIIANVRIDVFVIVAVRQLSQLPVETLAAGILFTRSAPAIPSPVAKGFDQRAQQRLVGQDAPAFAHGDVVSRIKADGREIAEGSDFLSAIG